MGFWQGITRLLFALFLAAVLTVVPVIRLCHMAVVWMAGVWQGRAGQGLEDGV